MFIKEGLVSQHGLRAVLREISNRQKVLRFFQSVAKSLLEPDGLFTCHASNEKLRARSAVVLPCGHCGCAEAFLKSVKQCGCCPVDGCREQNITVPDVLELGEVSLAQDVGPSDKAGNGPFGSKFACMIEQLRTILKEEESNRVLLFVQLPSLMLKLQEAMRTAKVKFATLAGDCGAMHEAMCQFKESKGADARVLLLMLDESCSGANLTAANYVFFAHPVLKCGQRSPADIEAQAVGRARRFGQERVVKVLRFVSKGTAECKLEEQNQMERRE